MKKIILFTLVLLLLFKMGFSQYSGLSLSLDRTQFCSQSSTIKVTGSVTAASGAGNGYHFVGMIFHFYYLNGSQQQIGTYSISTSSSFVVTSHSYSNQSPVYFDGNQISGGQVVSNTYSPGSPNNGGTFVMSFDLPWYAFPTSTGVQFYVAVEAIDQQGSTTVISSKVAFDNPILNPNPPLSKPAVSASTTTLCGSDIATLSTNPDLSFTYNYLWYKDGSVYGSGSTVTTTAPGTYSAYIYDACQNVTTDPVVISAGQPPSAPTVSSSNGTILCNGASTTLTATPTAGGVIHWNNGATGNNINVSTTGTYYAYEENHCGISGSSNAVTISVTSTPSAPIISSSNGNISCNGASTTLSTTPTAGGVINWNTGATGNSISVSAAGNYYATETNGCGTSINSNAISLATNSTPPSPSVQSSNGNLLCNGAATTLSTTVSGGGTIHWNTGATGNSITVSGQGNYFAYEMNTCGTSPSSNSIPITTGSSPATPSISSSNGTFIC
ncbi:MAG: conserved repeat domain protein, partial [Chitinophagaceae bacterium]|nr:conserved repeat domain protein [Chitinophagaceae bacterium]